MCHRNVLAMKNMAYVFILSQSEISYRAIQFIFIHEALNQNNCHLTPRGVLDSKVKTLK